MPIILSKPAEKKNDAGDEQTQKIRKMDDPFRDPWSMKPWSDVTLGGKILVRIQHRGRLLAMQTNEEYRSVAEHYAAASQRERSSEVWIFTPTQAVAVVNELRQKGLQIKLSVEIEEISCRESELRRTSDPSVISLLSRADRFERGQNGLLFEPKKIQEMRSLLEAIGPEHPFNRLYPYQKSGVLATLAGGGRIILGDEMGLGKSSQFLVSAEIGLATKRQPVLCVAPKSMVYEWVCQASNRQKDPSLPVGGWAPSFRPTVIANQKEAGPFCERLAAEGGSELVIVSWGLFPLILEALRKVSWAGVVLDEDHAAKEVSSQRTKAQLEIGAGVPFRVAITGTPLLNRPMELWPLLHFVDPLQWPSYFLFGKRYGGRMDARGRFRGAVRSEELGQALRNHMVRRTKKQVMPDLPGQKIRIIRVPRALGLPDAAPILERLRDGDDPEALSEFTKLRRLTALAKIDAAVDLILRAVRAEEPIVVFFTHKAVREGIYEKLLEAKDDLDKKEIGIIVGSTSPKKRQRVKEAFQAGQLKVLLGSEAARDGITLTHGRATLHVEPWFVPELERQAMARVNRIGQTEETWHLFLQMEDSLDDGHMAGLSERKRELVRKTLADDED